MHDISWCSYRKMGHINFVAIYLRFSDLTAKQALTFWKNESERFS